MKNYISAIKMLLYIIFTTIVANMKILQTIANISFINSYNIMALFNKLLTKNTSIIPG